MEPLNELLFKIADDALIIGHRNSEWTGIGPILEEDISMASMAQDKVGHAQALYTILHEQLGEKNPDALAFLRNENEFKCCHLVEYPIGEFDFTIVRHFLFDNAEAIRYEMLLQSCFEPLARLAKKIKGELKYHVFHANNWFYRLATGTEESNLRMQSTLNEVYPVALGIFEASPFEKQLIEEKIFTGEKILQQRWQERITELVDRAQLHLPEVKNTTIGFGGRNGFHTEHLQSLLNEMGEVIRSEEKAVW